MSAVRPPLVFERKIPFLDISAYVRARPRKHFDRRQLWTGPSIERDRSARPRAFSPRRATCPNRLYPPLPYPAVPRKCSLYVLSVDVAEVTAVVEMLGVVGAFHGCLAFASGLAVVAAGRMMGFGICLCQVKKASPSSSTLPGYLHRCSSYGLRGSFRQVRQPTVKQILMFLEYFLVLHLSRQVFAFQRIFLIVIELDPNGLGPKNVLVAV